MAVEIVSTDKAPMPVGSYSQAVKSNGFVFVSGQIPIDVTTGLLSTEGMHKEIKIILYNIAAILEAAGSSLDRVVKFTVYLKDINDIKFVNDVLKEVYGDSPPARSTVEVSKLPKEARIEIDAIAEV